MQAVDKDPGIMDWDHGNGADGLAGVSETSCQCFYYG